MSEVRFGAIQHPSFKDNLPAQKAAAPNNELAELMSMIQGLLAQNLKSDMKPALNGSNEAENGNTPAFSNVRSGMTSENKERMFDQAGGGNITDNRMKANLQDQRERQQASLPGGGNTTADRMQANMQDQLARQGAAMQDAGGGGNNIDDRMQANLQDQQERSASASFSAQIKALGI